MWLQERWLRDPLISRPFLSRGLLVDGAVPLVVIFTRSPVDSLCNGLLTDSSTQVCAVLDDPFVASGPGVAACWGCDIALGVAGESP